MNRNATRRTMARSPACSSCELLCFIELTAARKPMFASFPPLANNPLIAFARGQLARRRAMPKVYSLLRQMRMKVPPSSTASTPPRARSVILSDKARGGGSTLVSWLGWAECAGFFRTSQPRRKDCATALREFGFAARSTEARSGLNPVHFFGRKTCWESRCPKTRSQDATWQISSRAALIHVALFETIRNAIAGFGGPFRLASY